MWVYIQRNHGYKIIKLKLDNIMKKSVVGERFTRILEK